MRILALETSGVAGSVAALDDDRLLAEVELDPQGRSAQSLAPALVALWQRATWQPGDVQLVAVTLGPGSFTGLRVGVTTAKILAYAARAEVLGVDTLAAVACRAPHHVAELSAAIDAQRGQVVAQSFQRQGDALVPLGPQQLLDVDVWLSAPASGAALTGPVLRKLSARVPPHVQVLDEQYWNPTAAAVGRLAFRLYQAGERADLWKLLPRYSRRAAAEEKWDGAVGGRQ